MSRSSRGRGGSHKGGGGLGGLGLGLGLGGRDAESHLDGLNTSMTQGLATKLGQLKGLAMGLEGEAKDHLPLLDEMEDDMEGGGMRLGGSAGRLRNMGRTRGMSGRRLTCWVALALFAVLLIFYYFLLPLTASTSS